ncbi:MAG: histidinol dehydrogenase [Omnitrophica bacterium GWA2_50_21]|nr:MAG: histidinol dehydrogenase [Omnitrophica bacterium GWA2_50_21]
MQYLKWDKTTLRRMNRGSDTPIDKELFKKVNRILWDVKERGDLAVRRFTREFDGIDIPLKKLRVSEGEINLAFEKINFQFVPLLKTITENVKRYYEKDLRHSFKIQGKDGTLLGKIYTPLRRVGIYIPGGQAPLVSTVYMTVIPAKIAGVEEIVIATPPNRETGEIDPHILAVANLLGVKEIYRVGGAQAIAALAFGTRTIAKVDKIAGPGNPYVTEAKRQVYGYVDIDMIAGPSEVCIIADSTADPNFITCDLLAQVEHFGGTGILVTNSRRIIELMKKRVESGFIIHVDNLEQACEAVNEIAPEHVEIMTQNPQRLLKHVKNAGSIFLGPYSPAVIGDYIAGPSHVLPTGGTAHYFSALSAADFIKSAQVISYTKEALAKVREPVRKLTEMEGLVLHRISLEARFLDGEIKKEKEEEINEIKKS